MWPIVPIVVNNSIEKGDRLEDESIKLKEFL